MYSCAALVARLPGMTYRLSLFLKRCRGGASIMEPKKNVLIVEDNDVIRNALAEFLLRKGFEIGIAKNGREGLKIFNDRNFDLVLTDFRMPYMNGLLLASEIKKKKPRTIIIMMSGDAQMSPRTKGAADHILPKPFGIKEIYDLMSSVFEAANSEREGLSGSDGSFAVAMC
jgi:DNA-binding response OmpR family regulator